MKNEKNGPSWNILLPEHSSKPAASTSPGWPARDNCLSCQSGLGLVGAGAEIDVLAVSRVERQALVGECKWSQKPVGTNVFEQLKQKAQAISVEFPQLHYALFSRSGFTPALEAQAQDEKVALYHLDEIVRAG